MSAYLHERQAPVNDGQTYTATDVWIVRSPSGGNVCGDAQLPAINSVHPIDNRLRLDRYADARSADDNLGQDWYVSLLYSSDARFRFTPTRDTNNLLFRGFSDTFTLTTKEVPYFVKQNNVYKPNAPGFVGAPTPQTIWKQAKVKIAVAVENVQRTLQLNSYTSAQRNAIAAQYGKYHYLASSPRVTDFINPNPPGGLLNEVFKFNGCQVTQIQTSEAAPLWKYTYSWTREAGIKQITATDLTGKGLLFAPDKPAFHHYVIKPGGVSSTPTGIPPTIVIEAEYTTADFTGYSGANGLPGNPV